MIRPPSNVNLDARLNQSAGVAGQGDIGSMAQRGQQMRPAIGGNIAGRLQPQMNQAPAVAGAGEAARPAYVPPRPLSI